MNKSKIEHQIRKLIIASDSFHHCLFLLEHMTDEKIDGSSNLFPCMLSGVVVTYAKNFNSANGLGPLPSSYEKFPSENFNIAHSKILNSRNTVYAHRDQKSHAFKGDDGGIHNFPVQVKLDEARERFLFSPHLVDISSSKIPEIIALIKFQLERLQTDLDNKLINIVDDMSKYKSNTEYYLGVDFP